MKLSRRDALIAVAASAVGVAGAGELADQLDSWQHPPDVEGVVTGLQPLAEVVYPSMVEPTPEFLRTHVIGRTFDQEGYVQASSDALDGLQTRSHRRFGRSFGDLSVDRRDQFLREIGVAATTPDPDGTTVERIRYYGVNQLLLSLYTSPTGSELLGNENPPGYPGGRDAYQEGPTDG